jgi:hypothetical protein
VSRSVLLTLLGTFVASVAVPMTIRADNEHGTNAPKPVIAALQPMVDKVKGGKPLSDDDVKQLTRVIIEKSAATDVDVALPLVDEVLAGLKKLHAAKAERKVYYLRRYLVNLKGKADFIAKNERLKRLQDRVKELENDVIPGLDQAVKSADTDVSQKKEASTSAANKLKTASDEAKSYGDAVKVRDAVQDALDSLQRDLPAKKAAATAAAQKAQGNTDPQLLEARNKTQKAVDDANKDIQKKQTELAEKGRDVATEKTKVGEAKARALDDAKLAAKRAEDELHAANDRLETAKQNLNTARTERESKEKEIRTVAAGSTSDTADASAPTTAKVELAIVEKAEKVGSKRLYYRINSDSRLVPLEGTTTSFAMAIPGEIVYLNGRTTTEGTRTYSKKSTVPIGGPTRLEFKLENTVDEKNAPLIIWIHESKPLKPAQEGVPTSHRDRSQEGELRLGQINDHPVQSIPVVSTVSLTRNLPPAKRLAIASTSSTLAEMGHQDQLRRRAAKTSKLSAAPASRLRLVSVSSPTAAAAHQNQRGQRSASAPHTVQATVAQGTAKSTNAVAKFAVVQATNKKAPKLKNSKPAEPDKKAKSNAGGKQAAGAKSELGAKTVAVAQAAETQPATSRPPAGNHGVSSRFGRTDTSDRFRTNDPNQANEPALELADNHPLLQKPAVLAAADDTAEWDVSIGGLRAPASEDDDIDRAQNASALAKLCVNAMLKEELKGAPKLSTRLKAQFFYVLAQKYAADAVSEQNKEKLNLLYDIASKEEGDTTDKDQDILFEIVSTNPDSEKAIQGYMDVPDVLTRLERIRRILLDYDTRASLKMVQTGYRSRTGRRLRFNQFEDAIARASRQGRGGSSSVIQGYSPWTSDASNSYFTCAYYYLAVDAGAALHQCCVSFADDPAHVYFFSPATRSYWGRYTINGGLQPFSWLPDDQRYCQCLGERPLGKFRDDRVAMPPVPGSNLVDALMIEPPTAGISRSDAEPTAPELAVPPGPAPPRETPKGKTARTDLKKDRVARSALVSRKAS